MGQAECSTVVPTSSARSSVVWRVRSSGTPDGNFIRHGESSFTGFISDMDDEGHER